MDSLRGKFQNIKGLLIVRIKTDPIGVPILKSLPFISVRCGRYGGYYEQRGSKESLGNQT